MTPETSQSRLHSIRHVIIVLSGKGGVGKSSVSTQLALSLYESKNGRDQPNRIGILDIDLTGPSIPRMLGVDGSDYSVHQSSDGWVPVYADDSEARMACMSVGFLVKRKSDSVVWRGPKKNAMIRQFLRDVRWGELDYLVIDTPPGTSDEHLSLIEHLSSALQSLGATQLPANPLHISAVLVTTPQAVALSDAIKSLSFARTVSIPTGPGSNELKPLPMLGIIENMSGYACPCCGEVTNVFSMGGGEEMAKKEKVRFLGRLPIDTELVDLLDNPRGVKEKESGGASPEEIQTGFLLMERYKRTPTFKIFEGIAKSIANILDGTGVVGPGSVIESQSV